MHNGVLKVTRPLSNFSFILLLGALSAFDPISIDMYLPSFLHISHDFKASIATVEMSLSVFFIALALGQLIYGPLADIFGRKQPLLIGMILYFIASVGCSLATTMSTFLFFRFLQGLGGCSGMVITRAIVSDLFDKQQAAHHYSTLMLIMGVSPIFAPSIGGYLSSYWGWRSIFLMLSFLSLLCIYFTHHFLPETQKKLTPPLSHLNPKNYALLIVKDYLDLFRDKSFTRHALAGGFARGAMFAYISGSPYVFMNYFKISNNRYGWIFGLNAIGIISASQVNRKLLKHFLIENIFKNAVVSLLIFSGILFLSSHIYSSLFAILIPLFALMTTIGLIMPNSSVLSLSSQAHRAGIASALLGTIQWSIAFLSSFLVGHFHNKTPTPMIVIICICCLLTFISFKMIKESFFLRPSLF
ncbi:MAG: multidrug effflux MFS transporter [Bacteriovorax sp.]|nr:multidrug effflux MFS transporter [Bacteriovorax sp.]